MGGSHLLNVYNSSNAYRIKRLTAYIPMSIKRFSEGKKVNEGDHAHHGGQEERAPSLAEEFRRVADEKTQRQSPHGSEKAPEDHGSTSEGTSSSSSSESESDDEESTKEIFKAPVGDAGVGETSSS